MNIEDKIEKYLTEDTGKYTAIMDKIKKLPKDSKGWISIPPSMTKDVGDMKKRNMFADFKVTATQHKIGGKYTDTVEVKLK